MRSQNTENICFDTQSDVLIRNVARMTVCLLLRGYLSQRLHQSANELISCIFLLRWLLGFHVTGRKGLPGGIPMAHFLMLTP